MSRPFSFIVTDTSPLLTLVLADSRQASDDDATRERLREQLLREDSKGLDC